MRDLQGLINWSRKLENKIYCDKAYEIIDTSTLSESAKRHLRGGVAAATDDKMLVSPRALYLVFHDFQIVHGGR